MSEDAARFTPSLDPLCEMHAVLGSEASERVARRLGEASAVPVLTELTVRRALDGGFTVNTAWATVFAAGTINEVCEYLEDRFS